MTEHGMADRCTDVNGTEERETPGRMYRAVIVDLDRTLLRTDKSISDVTRSVLRDCEAAGMKLYVATARPERAIADYRRILGFRSVATLNGARTITPERVYANTIPTESAVRLIRSLQKIDGTVISVETEDGFYANTDIPIWQPIVTEDIAAIPGKTGIYKIIASHPEIPIDELPVSLTDDVYSTIADRKLMQIMSRDATKWNGILQMLQADGIPSEQAIYFGDDMDDIEPLQRCGRGVAVANALPQVKESADDVTASNDEDGVAEYLRRIN